MLVFFSAMQPDSDRADSWVGFFAATSTSSLSLAGPDKKPTEHKVQE